MTLFEEPQYGSSAKLSRLLRERIKAGVEADALEKMGEITMDLAVRLAEPVGMVRNLMATKASEAISLVGADENDWPPCMRKAVAELSNGVNLNHFGRLFLASMAATLALPKEACVGFFRGAPGFQRKHDFVPGGPRIPTRIHAVGLWQTQSESQLPCASRAMTGCATNLGWITRSNTSAPPNVGRQRTSGLKLKP